LNSRRTSVADWLRRIGPTAIGVAALLAVWTLAAQTFSASRVVPSPWEVAEQLWLDRAILPGNIWTTMREALLGYFWGNLAAILLAVLFAEFAAVERVLLKIAIASYCAPLVAIAPILIVVLSGDGPKVALAALAVFFTTLVATVLGLRSMDAVSVDLIRSAGGGAWKLFRLVRIPGALPSLFAGLPRRRAISSAWRGDRGISWSKRGAGGGPDPGPILLRGAAHVGRRARPLRIGRFLLRGRIARRAAGRALGDP
jgi:ABC-type nitrate/sulfonate/bicarbonate transport system permease component